MKMSIEDELREKGVDPSSCEPDMENNKLVCETEDGTVEFGKEDFDLG